MNQRWVLVAAGFSVALSASAAAPQRTFVASYGLDTNPCSLTAPCRGFQAAIDAVVAGGEVVVLDSAGYGAVEIHKAVSVIVPTGIHAGLSPSTGIPLPAYPGQSGVILIDIQDTDVVVLRGLVINHQGAVTGGIEWISAHGGTVQIENAVINGFPMEGLYVQAPEGFLYVKDSVFRNNNVGIYGGQAGHQYGVPGGIFIDHCRVEDSQDAVKVISGVGATVSNSSIFGNEVAFYLDASGNDAMVWLHHDSVLGNNSIYTLISGAHYAQLFAADSGFFRNAGPGSKSGGNASFWSYGNNETDGGVIFDLAIPPT